MRDLRALIAGNARLPLENLRLILQGNVLHDSKYGDDISVHFNNGGITLFHFCSNDNHLLSFRHFIQSKKETTFCLHNKLSIQ